MVRKIIILCLFLFSTPALSIPKGLYDCEIVKHVDIILSGESRGKLVDIPKKILEEIGVQEYPTATIRSRFKVSIEESFMVFPKDERMFLTAFGEEIISKFPIYENSLSGAFADHDEHYIRISINSNYSFLHPR